MGWEVVECNGVSYVDTQPDNINAPMLMIDQLFEDWNILHRITREISSLWTLDTNNKWEEALRKVVDLHIGESKYRVYGEIVEFINWYNLNK